MKKKIEAFKIVGISVRTTNENMQAAKDIPLLWSKFFSENISGQVPEKITDEIYSLYTNYEKDHTKPYDTIIGYKVNASSATPAGLVEKHINEHDYMVFTASGKASESFVFNAWQEIWNTKIDRAFTTDFEVYGAESQDPENAKVEIYIALN